MKDIIKKDLDWTSGNSYDASLGSQSPPIFPCEYLVKTLSSGRNTGIKPFPINQPIKVLEIGSFGANNLRFLWERGYKDIYGIELTPSLVELCRESTNKLCNGEIPKENIMIGSNLEIPFEDNFFDLIISVNTIHYSIGIEIPKVLNLWHKKLKKNGRVFVQTAGPDHDAVKNAKRISENNWTWGQGAGFREGKPAGFFDDENHFKKTLEKKFNKVSIGKVTEKSEYITVDFLSALCVK